MIYEQDLTYRQNAFIDALDCDNPVWITNEDLDISIPVPCDSCVRCMFRYLK